jgi:hypothetical protein
LSFDQKKTRTTKEFEKMKAHRLSIIDPRGLARLSLFTALLLLALALPLSWLPITPAAAQGPTPPVVPPAGTQPMPPGPAVRPALPKTQQAFYQAGIYGALTVTTSGSGCGTFLTFGGITGLWLGNNNTSESCTFNISPAVSRTSVKVAMTAHSCPVGNCEKVRFRLNGADYNVLSSDVNNTTPSGGSPLVVLPSGEVEGSPIGGGDGRGTVSFSSGPTAVTSLEISHIIESGSPNGTIYLIYADDAPSAAPTPTPVAPSEVPEADTLLLMGGDLGGVVTWLGWQRRKLMRKNK